jgi:hypothetical protein
VKHIYIDDTIQDRGDFVLGAIVVGLDAADWVANALRAEGLLPGTDEFKSSARMDTEPEQVRLRARLKRGLKSGYRIGVVVVARDARDTLGAEALQALKKVAAANGLADRPVAVHFDEGLFPSVETAEALARDIALPASWELHFEQDSRVVGGLQVADLVAHTCGVMLLDPLGMVAKKVRAGENSGYDPDLEIELGFELWATLRYQFLCGPMPDEEDTLRGFVDVASYGLHIAESCSNVLRRAAEDRFGTQYLGCIH